MKDGTKQWLSFADRDLAAAKQLSNNEYVANVVLFHCQQCIEKCFKAILEEYEVQVPKIHSVVRLFSIINEKIDQDLRFDEDALNLVDDIYIDTRYPSGIALLPSGFPSKEEAAKLIKIAEQIYGEVLEFLKKADK